jgi:hypothetical protein
MPASAASAPSIEGDAGDPHDAGRSRDLDDAPPETAIELQRPLPDGPLEIVARGQKENPAFAGSALP